MPYVQKTINNAWQKLKKVSEAPILETELLLAHAIQHDRIWVYSHPEKKIQKIHQKKFRGYIARRARGEPLAYILGYKNFFGLKILVNKNVLIPRSDTETLVEKILEDIQTKKKIGNKLMLADIGTGSGCIAIALKKHLPKATVLATDISSQALTVAKKNARLQRTPLQFFRGNLLSALPKKYYNKIDILVANLPYLPKNIAKKQSLRFEPNRALQDKNYLQTFLRSAPLYLKPSGKIYLETSFRHKKIIGNSGLPCKCIYF